MIPHPNFGDLNRYADRELSDRGRTRVASHLAKCSVCRGTVLALRGITTEAPLILAPKAPADALDKILVRQASGETVILPVADPPRRRVALGLLRSGAAAVAVALASGVAVFTVQELGAELSELNLTTIAASLGNTLAVEYKSTSLFADEDRLFIRGRYRIPGDEFASGPRGQVITAPLYRYDGNRFEGTVELPDSAVYTVFAIENAAGDAIDSRGGALWKVIKEDENGKPLYAGLVQKQYEWKERNGELALAAARQAKSLYPDKPEAWAGVAIFEALGVLDADPEVLRSRDAARFNQFERDFAGRSLTAEQLAGMYLYSITVSAPDRFEYWRSRLFAEAPGHPTAVQARVFDILDRYTERPDLALEELEELWQAHGSAHAELPRKGVALALRTGVVSHVDRWADRKHTIEPAASFNDAMAMLEIPALRTSGMNRLREQLARWDADADQNRALQSTVREDRLRVAALRRRAFVALGKALVETGQPVAGLDTLTLAVSTGWDANAFGAMAHAYIGLGDTERAVTMLARVVVDPGTHPPAVDSLEALGVAAIGWSAWDMLRQGALTEMYQRTLTESIGRSVPEDVEVVDDEGKRHRLRDLTAGRVTFIALWTRFCNRCIEQVDKLEEVAARLRATAPDAANAMVVTDGPPSAELRRLIEAHQITLPLFYDESLGAHRALGAWEIPNYVVLGGAGRVQFARTQLSEVVRRVEALRSRDHQ